MKTRDPLASLSHLRRSDFQRRTGYAIRMRLDRGETERARGLRLSRAGAAAAWARRRKVLALTLFALASGCATKTAEKGDECTRTNQCASGLACVKGVCSSDLRSIASQSQVPELMMAKAAAGVDGGG